MPSSSCVEFSVLQPAVPVAHGVDRRGQRQVRWRSGDGPTVAPPAAFLVLVVPHVDAEPAPGWQDDPDGRPPRLGESLIAIGQAAWFALLEPFRRKLEEHVSRDGLLPGSHVDDVGPLAIGRMADLDHPTLHAGTHFPFWMKPWSPQCPQSTDGESVNGSQFKTCQ